MDYVILYTNIIYIILSFVNVVLHSIGIYFMACIYRNGQRTSPQQLYLMNLGCTEVVINFFVFVIRVLFVVYLYHHSHRISAIIYYLTNIIFSVLIYLYISAIFYLTADRLFCVLLNIRYPILWTHKKARNLIIITWIVNLLICLVTSLIFYFSPQMISGGTFYGIIGILAPTVLLCSFLVFAVIAYTIMFWKYASSRRKISLARNPGAHQESLFRIFRNSRFFMSMILITSSLVLAVIPTLIYALMKITNNKIALTFSQFHNFCSMLSDTADGIIYIMLQPSVRTLIHQKLHSVLRHCTSIRHSRQRNITVESTTLPNVSEKQLRTEDVQSTTRL